MDSAAEGGSRRLWCASLLERLRLEGFDIGVGQVLLIERLLDRIGPESRSWELRGAICPIVARNPEEQRRFYQVFAEYLAPAAVLYDPARPGLGPSDVTMDHRLPTTRIEQAPVVRWWQRRIVHRAAGFVAVVAVVVLIGKVLYPKQPDGSTGPVPPPSSQPPPDTIDTIGGPQVVPGAVVPLEVLDPPLAAPVRDWRFVRYGIAGMPLLALSLFLWRRRRRREAVAERESSATAPFVWPIKIPAAPTALYPVSDFAASSRVLRRRQQGSEVQFSAERTITATIEALGYPTICFEPLSRPSEYVALIERTSRRDHQAMFFDGLIRRLAAEGVFITAYFFDHDPRVCFSDESTRGIRLPDLARQREGDRLLVFADGYRFLHPVRGTPLPWLELLESWTDRALLTPVPPRHWGRREGALRGCLDILPATLEGIRAAADHFEIRTRPDLARWKERDRSEPQLRVGPHSEVSEIRAALGDDLFRWVAACAAYPELHWDLTALLGGLSEVGTGVFSERNVLRLIRLPWFRDGKMPAELQTALLEELERMDRGTGVDTERAVRQTILRVLQQEQVTPKSLAGLTRSREILQQHLYLYLERSAAAQRAIDQLKHETPAEELLHDVTVVRLLEKKAANRRTFRLPPWFRQWLWRGGIPGMGPTRLAAAGSAGVLSALALWLIPAGQGGRTGLRATIYPEILAIQGPPDTRVPIGTPVIEPEDTVTVVWVSSDPGVAAVDTNLGPAAIQLVSAGTTEVRPGPRLAGVPIRIEVTSGLAQLADTAAPPTGVIKLGLTMDAGERSSPSVTWGAAPIVSCDTTVARVIGPQTVRAVAAGSTILVDGSGGTGLMGVRVLHVVDAADSLERFIEEPIDRWSEAPTARYDSAVVRKVRAFIQLHAADPAARLLVTFHLVGERYLSQMNQQQISGPEPRAPENRRALALQTLLATDGAASGAIKLTPHVSGLSCGGHSFGPAVRDGDLDRVDFVVVREAVITEPPVPFSISLEPSALQLYLGDSRQVQLNRSGDNSRPRADTNARWCSSVPRVADVSQTGLVQARNVGRTTVTAELGTATARVDVRVRDSVAPIPTVTVPSFIGATLDRAALLLKQSALEVGRVDTTTRPSCSVGPAGITVSRPAAGSTVPRGTRVNLSWSAARDSTVIVPDLIRQTPAAANRVASALCLRLATTGPIPAGLPGVLSLPQAQAPPQVQTQSQAPPSVPPGTISSQRPAPGVTTSIGTIIYAVVEPVATINPSDRDFATRLYRDLLGRYDSLAVMQLTRDLAGGQSRIAVIRQLAQAREAASMERPEFVRRAFRAITCRDPSDPELKTLYDKYLSLLPGRIVEGLLQDSELAGERAKCLGAVPGARAP